MNIGFIGAGNMGCALMKSIKGEPVGCYDINENAMKNAAENYQAHIFDTAEALCTWADLVFIAVKPQVLPYVVMPLSGVLSGKPVVSIAPGYTIEKLTEYLPESRICRVMPNTPAMVGEGMFAIAEESTVSGEETEFIKYILSFGGRVVPVKESLIDAVVAISGSGPAYVFMLIEALSDAGVREGLSYPIAKELAAQTVLGGARMVLETGLHPAELKNRVCSPAGTTIDAVALLESRGFRSALIDAAHICAEKSKHMGK